ncbi:MAG: hypothetical protein ACTHW6_04255 [Agrococcus casei]|uniref:hypothetical protein n=1 Tax=Agrococcus casei TaxID=343512 RepID=UPI003F904222
MSGDQLTIHTPAGRVIAEPVSDYEAIAENAAQLQATGEETIELDRFVLSIINGEIEVQEGISIDALQQMALTVGDSLGPLGEYFCKVAEAAWIYHEACSTAVDATKHLKGRQDNLQQSLLTLVNQREDAELLKQQTYTLPDDDTASGTLTSYTVLDTEGMLNATPVTSSLAGKKRDDAMRAIESNLTGLATMHEMVHARQDRQLEAFDTAYEEWEVAAGVFADSLDGVLGVLKDTDAENAFQRDGSFADALGTVGGVADMASAIPGVGLVAAALGVATSLLEAGYQIHQANRLHGEGDKSIRVAEGQVRKEYGDAGVAVLGLIPFVDFARLYGKNQPKASDVETPEAPAPNGHTVRPESDAPDERRPDLPVDVGVDTSPIDGWAGDAEETNPDYDYSPNEPVGGVPDQPPVRIPEAEEPGSDGEPVQIPEAEQPMEVEVDGEDDGTGIEVEVEGAHG